VTRVPFTDLRAMHEEVRGEIEAAWRDLVDRSAFVGGPAVADFERAFAAYCGVPHAIGVGTGTDAVRVALQAVGVAPGDAVVTVPHTFIATVEGITQAGAHPVFVDIDPACYTLDPNRLADYLASSCRRQPDGVIDRGTGKRVTCVVPVDLYGQPADYDALTEICERYDLRLVEDACQAHGATLGDRTCGSFGDAAAFSFYPGKNLGAMGEGGAVTTRHAAVAERCRVLRDHGSRERYVHVRADGSNARLDALQAVVLSAKLKRLDTWNAARQRVAAWYAEALGVDNGVVAPTARGGATHVYHLYVVLVDDRDAVRSAFERAGVATGLHYPVPLHLQEAYTSLGWRQGAFPVSERIAASCLSLPMFPHMRPDDVTSVATIVARLTADAERPIA
jgi:dTDP-4-amino-4,6-dideoxygalactose transaminase